MVVLSAAICTKSGKALISRQFVEMTRIRIEGLLAAFPKLIGSDSKQHTFIETDTVRYVYQPLENLYLLLITNRASNIVEDLETLRLLSKGMQCSDVIMTVQLVVPDVAGSTNNLTEEKISDNCFELLFAFDEVLTAGGYREPITLQQIHTNLEMDSHEEKLFNMIKLSKVETAKDAAKDAERAIRERQREQKRLGEMSGIGGGNYDSTYNSGSLTINKPVDTSYQYDYKPSPKAPVVAVKGMSLTANTAKNKSLEDALVKEDKLAPIITTSAKNTIVADHTTAAPIIQQPIMLSIVERVNAKMTRDGMVDSHEIKGTLTLTANTDDVGMCSVQMTVGSVEAFTFNTHPKLNKQLYDQSGLLRLKDITKGFPSARPVGILRWSYASTTDDLIPLKINCWPQEESRGQMNVSIEYTLEQNITLHDVRIKIPLGTAESPNILACDGTYKHSANHAELEWQINLIDQSNASGSLEFNILQRSQNAFFPVTVSFTSHQLFCNVDVANVTTADGSSPIMYGSTKHMSTEEYIIE